MAMPTKYLGHKGSQPPTMLIASMIEGQYRISNGLQSVVVGSFDKNNMTYFLIWWIEVVSCGTFSKIFI